MEVKDRKRLNGAGLFGDGVRRPRLFAADPNSDKLLENLPCGSPENIAALRSWMRLLLREVSQWQIAKAKERSGQRALGKQMQAAAGAE